VWESCSSSVINVTLRMKLTGTTSTGGAVVKLHVFNVSQKWESRWVFFSREYGTLRLGHQ
jgi:hypothetical protein